MPMRERGQDDRLDLDERMKLAGQLSPFGERVVLRRKHRAGP